MPRGGGMDDSEATESDEGDALRAARKRTMMWCPRKGAGGWVMVAMEKFRLRSLVAAAAGAAATATARAREDVLSESFEVVRQGTVVIVPARSVPMRVCHQKRPRALARGAAAASHAAAAPRGGAQGKPRIPRARVASSGAQRCLSLKQINRTRRGKNVLRSRGIGGQPRVTTSLHRALYQRVLALLGEPGLLTKEEDLSLRNHLRTLHIFAGPSSW